MIMDVVNNLIADLGSGDKKKQLMLLVYGHGLCAFAFLICSFVVASTANAGFDVVLTALLNISWCAGAYYVINKSKTPIAVSKFYTYSITNGPAYITYVLIIVI